MVVGHLLLIQFPKFYEDPEQGLFTVLASRPPHDIVFFGNGDISPGQ